MLAVQTIDGISRVSAETPFTAVLHDGKQVVKTFAGIRKIETRRQVIAGTAAECEAEIKRAALDASSLPQPEPLESQVQRALAQRDQIDAFLTRPEVTTVVQQMQAAGKLQPAGGLQAEHG